MPRLPYVFPELGASGIADTIRLRRAGGQLTELDGILLTAPNIAEGYNQFLKAVRTANSLPDDLREIMILRVAALNCAAYEWIQHEPLARAAGISASQLRIIRTVSADTGNGTKAHDSLTQPESSLSELQAAALRYTDYMTRSVSVPDDVFDALRCQLKNDQQMFEATSTIAAYNMVSRILVSLDVGDKAKVDVPWPSMS